MEYGAKIQVTITELVMFYFLRLLLLTSVIISLYALYPSYLLNESNITLTKLNVKSCEFSTPSKCHGRDYVIVGYHFIWAKENYIYWVIAFAKGDHV